MKKDTPPKHKTPNYKEVWTHWTGTDARGNVRHWSTSEWRAVPLRKDRKDLS